MNDDYFRMMDISIQVVRLWVNLITAITMVNISTSYTRDLALTILALTLYNSRLINNKIFGNFKMVDLCSASLFIVFIMHINFQFPILLGVLSWVIGNYLREMDWNLNKDDQSSNRTRQQVFDELNDMAIYDDQVDESEDSAQVN